MVTHTFAHAHNQGPIHACDSVASLMPQELTFWLEWGGAKLLSLTLSSPLPQGYKSNWPAISGDASVAYGYSDERLRPAMPNSKEIALMDQILLLPALISEALPRRIVNARAMVRPVANIHLYSWAKLARMVHTDRRRVMRLHARGLDQIIARVEDTAVYTIRKSLHVITT